MRRVGILFALVCLVNFCSGIAIAADQVEQGRELYTRYCAACHGLNADGNGPLASVMKTPPANLRKLSERYGNPLPSARIAAFIDGSADVKAHGLRDMPVWGQRFDPEKERSPAGARPWLSALVAYLQSIQGVPPAALR